MEFLSGGSGRFVGGGGGGEGEVWGHARRRVGAASSLRGNEGESVSRIAIRLKILSGPWDPWGSDWSAPVEKESFSLMTKPKWLPLIWPDPHFHSRPPIRRFSCTRVYRVTQKNNGRRGGAETKKKEGREIDHPWQRDRRDRSIRTKVATEGEREREVFDPRRESKLVVVSDLLRSQVSISY